MLYLAEIYLHPYGPRVMREFKGSYQLRGVQRGYRCFADPDRDLTRQLKDALCCNNPR